MALAGQLAREVVSPETPLRGLHHQQPLDPYGCSLRREVRPESKCTRKPKNFTQSVR